MGAGLLFPLSLMIYPLSLWPAFLIAGAALVFVHGIALLRPAAAKSWLKAFPRSRAWGLALLFLAAVWSFILIWTIDLGEFSNWRPRLLVIIPIAAILTGMYVEEFLAVRALGMLALLGAEPFLEAAWLRPEPSRLLLVALMYFYIVLGMFWIGMPYVLRDQIAWLSKSESRWRTAALLGVGYGAVLIARCCLQTLHRSS